MASDGPTGFLAGLGFVGRGFGFLVARPKLYVWVVAPVFLAIGLLWWAWRLAWSWTPWLLNAWLPRPVDPGFAQNLWNSFALVGVLWAFATVAIVLLTSFGVVGAPFYDRLSMAVEHELRPEQPVMGWREELVAVGWSVFHSLGSGLVWVAAMVLLALVALIPVIGPVVELVGSVAVTSLFVARERLDGPMSRRRFPFARKLRVVRAELPVMFGFGLGAAALLIVPLLNVLALPVAVVGGTLLFLELERDGRVAS